MGAGGQKWGRSQSLPYRICWILVQITRSGWKFSIFAHASVSGSSSVILSNFLTSRKGWRRTEGVPIPSRACFDRQGGVVA